MTGISGFRRREQTTSSLRFLKPLLLSTVILGAACSNRASTFVAAPEPAGNQAVVYLYRPAASANFMMSPRVVIDDEEKFSIANGDHRYVYMRQGDHRIGLAGTDQYRTAAPLKAQLEAGNSYYLRVNTSLTFEADSMNTRRFWLDIVDEEQARAEIAGTDYAGPEPHAASAAQTRKPDDTPGFSVDRTQDPFAGKYD